jgi:energy-coupling factor transport system permease protein
MIETLYQPGRGLLYRLDPRSKGLFAVSAVIYLAIESDPTVLLAALIALHVLALAAQSRRRRILSLWTALLPLLTVIVLLGSIRWRTPDAWFTVGPIAVTLEALWMAVGLAARIAGISLCLSLVMWTTEPGDAVQGLVRLGLPFELSFPIVMALEYVATFRRQFRSILEAQQSRGLVFARRNPVQVVRAYVPVLIPLIISALRTSDNLALALQTRGFGVGSRRTSRRQLRLKARDGIFVLATWGILLTIVLFRV